MDLPDNLDDLHLVAEYHTACRALRRLGWSGIVFGLISAGLGILFIFMLSPINASLAVLGGLLVASGIWCLALPVAEGIIFMGIALILVGIWNIFVTVVPSISSVLKGVPGSGLSRRCSS